MTLPTFICIGAPRCGSTWLYKLLATHPEIYVPPRRKDVRFFTSFYERGFSWYETFFPAEEKAFMYKAIGEVSPDYLYCPECPKRLSNMPSIKNLIVILRRPENRLFSKYKDCITSNNYRKTFEDFIKEYPDQVEQGFYSRFLANHFEVFPKEKILILFFEKAVTDVAKTKIVLGNFLKVSPQKFPSDAGMKKVNASSIPQAGQVYSFAYKITSFVRNTCGLDKFVDFYLYIARKIGVRRLFGESKQKLEMKEETARYLNSLYKKERKDLEKLLDINLSWWK